MFSKEQELLDQIAEAEANQKEASNKMAKLKMECMRAESDLIFHNLTKERLVEELRVFRATSVFHNSNRKAQ